MDGAPAEHSGLGLEHGLDPQADAVKGIAAKPISIRPARNSSSWAWRPMTLEFESEIGPGLPVRGDGRASRPMASGEVAPIRSNPLTAAAQLAGDDVGTARLRIADWPSSRKCRPRSEKTRRLAAVRIRQSPVRLRERPTSRLTAGWLNPSASAARVTVPTSRTARAARSSEIKGSAGDGRRDP